MSLFLLVIFNTLLVNFKQFEATAKTEKKSNNKLLQNLLFKMILKYQTGKGLEKFLGFSLKSTDLSLNKKVNKLKLDFPLISID